jgi:hypothetical protein
MRYIYFDQGQYIYIRKIVIINKQFDYFSTLHFKKNRGAERVLSVVILNYVSFWWDGCHGRYLKTKLDTRWANV